MGGCQLMSIAMFDYGRFSPVKLTCISDKNFWLSIVLTRGYVMSCHCIYPTSHQCTRASSWWPDICGWGCPFSLLITGALSLLVSKRIITTPGGDYPLINQKFSSLPSCLIMFNPIWKDILLFVWHESCFSPLPQADLKPVFRDSPFFPQEVPCGQLTICYW